MGALGSATGKGGGRAAGTGGKGSASGGGKGRGRGRGSHVAGATSGKAETDTQPKSANEKKGLLEEEEYRLQAASRPVRQESAEEIAAYLAARRKKWPSNRPG